MVELVFDLAGDKPEVDGYGYCPELLESIVRLYEFRAVVQQDRGMVASFFTPRFLRAFASEFTRSLSPFHVTFAAPQVMAMPFALKRAMSASSSPKLFLGLDMKNLPVNKLLNAAGKGPLGAQRNIVI